MIYLCIISIVGLSLSFSRYTSGDTKTEDARAAIYDVEIHSGDLQSVEQNMTMTVYATSKISETKSMIDGTYEKKQVNIHNFSECDISLSDMGIQVFRTDEQGTVIAVSDGIRKTDYSYE